MRRGRSRVEAQHDGSARAVLTRRDASTLRYALTNAAVFDPEARDTLLHVLHWARYSSGAPVVVVPLPAQHLGAARSALREHIGMLPVESSPRARRLYRALLEPTDRRARRRWRRH